MQALSIGGAYPFASLSGMLYMLFLTIRECDERSVHAKLSLLLYYLLDLGHMQPDQAGARQGGEAMGRGRHRRRGWAQGHGRCQTCPAQPECSGAG